MTPSAFARLLVVVLPASLVLTMISKLIFSDSLRREAIAELYEISDRAAAEAPHVINYYVSAASSSSSDDGSSSSTGATCSDMERAALMRSGAKLAGAHADFLSKSGWGEVADCCRWKGVGCAGDGRRGSRGSVTSLSLARNALHGTLPTELARLPALTTLDVNENPNLSGTLPAALLASKTLTHLYAFGAALSGTLPAAIGGGAGAGGSGGGTTNIADGATGFDASSSSSSNAGSGERGWSTSLLQELELSSCKLSGTLPPSLGSASSLRYVFLEANRLSGSLPPSLGQLRRLKELELSKNRLSGTVPPRVKHLHLEHFDVANNNPALKGAPVAAAKGACSGGADKYLRGQQPTAAKAAAAAN